MANMAECGNLGLGVNLADQEVFTEASKKHIALDFASLRPNDEENCVNHSIAIQTNNVQIDSDSEEANISTMDTLSSLVSNFSEKDEDKF